VLVVPGVVFSNPNAGEMMMNTSPNSITVPTIFIFPPGWCAPSHKAKEGHDWDKVPWPS
jgi:hypothetical protein